MPQAQPIRASAPGSGFALLREVRSAAVPREGDLALTAAVLVPGVVVLGGVAVASLVSGEHVGTFTRDPMAVVREHPLTGVLSNLGAILWSAGAALPLFTWVALRVLGGGERFRGALLGGGLLTGLLLADDLFMLHEALYPRYLGLGEEGEGPILALYGLALATYLIRCRRRLLEGRPFLLVTALALFAGSVAIDQLPKDALVGRALLEDGAKFLGIGAWLVFQGSVCLAALRARD